MFISKTREKETANKKAKLHMSSISLGAFTIYVNKKWGWVGGQLKVAGGGVGSRNKG